MSPVKLGPAETDYFTDAETAADPVPYFDYLLANHPVWREPKYGVVIVTGYEEALQVYHHPEVYSSINRTGGPVLDLPVELAGDDLTDILERYRAYFPQNDQLVTFDPPMHTDHRAQLMGLITPKRLKENEEFLRRTADRFLDELVPKGQCEFIWDYGKPFAVLAVADLLGVPEADHPMLLGLLAAERGPVLGIVLLLHGAAGRDAREFGNPGEFDVRRGNARHHLAFGRGTHTCPGAPLARAEAVFSVRRRLERTERIDLSAEHHGPPGDRRWDLVRSYKFRGHQHLYLEYTEQQ